MDCADPEQRYGKDEGARSALSRRPEAFNSGDEGSYKRLGAGSSEKLASTGRLGAADAKAPSTGAATRAGAPQEMPRRAVTPRNFVRSTPKYR